MTAREMMDESPELDQRQCYAWLVGRAAINPSPTSITVLVPPLNVEVHPLNMEQHG